jgi:hypothetical protein
LYPQKSFTSATPLANATAPVNEYERDEHTQQHWLAGTPTSFTTPTHRLSGVFFFTHDCYAV